MRPEAKKIFLFMAALFFFCTGFVFNIIYDQPLYNENLNIVPQWQSNDVMGTKAFMIFMNIVSILLDPSVCAAYLTLFWLISSRKLEILVFLIWFIFISWVLSIVKSAIQYNTSYS